MSKEIYMTYSKLQTYLNDYFAKHKTEASMFDATYYLYNQKDFSYKPAKLKWQEEKFSNLSDLYQVLQNIAIDVTPIIRDPIGNQLLKNVSEHYFFNKRQDANILLQFQHDKNQLHQHNYFEINLVLRGSLTATLNKEKRILKKGDFLIISPNTIHQINVKNDSIVVCITIRKSTFDQAFFSLIQNDDPISNFFKYNLYSSDQNYLLFSIKINYQILETIQNIFIQAYSNSSQANIICYNYISILLSYGLEEFTAHTISSHNTTLTSKITTILNWIKQDSPTIKLEQIAKKIGYDKAYLGKLIIKNTGHSFNYLRNYYRISNSCQLLQFTDYSIEKISIKTGYSSPNHYERCFRQLMKTTPTKYRSNNKNN